MTAPRAGLVVWVAVMVVGCSARREPADPAPAASCPTGTHFIGCRPSVGECRASCAGADGVALADDPRCKGDRREPVGCCCPGEAAEPETHIGTVTTSGVCVEELGVCLASAGETSSANKCKYTTRRVFLEEGCKAESCPLRKDDVLCGNACQRESDCPGIIGGLRIQVPCEGGGTCLIEADYDGCKECR